MNRILLCLSLFTAVVPTMGQMHGNYTIGGIAPDYPGLAQALNAIYLLGDDAPVTFSIRAGVNDSTVISMYDIQANFPLTITSETDDPNDVSLTISSIGNCSTITLQYILIHPLRNNSIGWPYKGLQVTDCHQITFDHCIIQGGDDLDQRNGISVAHADGHTFTNNTFRDLDYALVYSDVALGGSQSNYTQGSNVIQHNVFDSTAVAIRLASGYFQGSLDVSYNEVSNSGYGIYADLTNDFSNLVYIHHNRTETTNAGIYVENFQGTPGWPLVVYDNMASSGTTNTIEISGSDHLNLLENSVFGGVYLHDDQAITMRNNCLHSDTTAVLFINYSVGPNGLVSDHNNLSRNNAGSLVYWGPTDVMYNDLQSYQIATGKESYSTSVDPMYTDDHTDLHATHPQIQHAGAPIASLTVDIDNEDRDSQHPDIGADEFNSSPLPPLAWFSSECGSDLTVEFTDESVRPGSVEWDFGDGSPISTVDMPIHTYGVVGEYDVRLVATNAYGSDTTTFPVDVTGSNEEVTFSGGVLSIGAGHDWYAWELNGNIIANETTNIYTPTQNGMYTALYRDGAGCTFHTPVYQFIVGIEESAQANGVFIYPIPAKEQIMVEGPWSASDRLDIRIMDLLGRCVLTTERSGNGALDVSGLSPGTFILQVQAAHGPSVRERIVIR